MNIQEFIFLIIGIVTGALSISAMLYLKQQDLDPSMIGWFYIIGCGSLSIVFLAMFFGWMPMVDLRW